ncbi:MAG: STAS domain-containing protein [Pyrinomonadaceae bacterium]
MISERVSELGVDPVVTTESASQTPAVVEAGDYLNKLTGERIERECREYFARGYKEVVVDFASTETVNSVGISILLGVIDSASNAGAKVRFSGVKDSTIELFEMLGITRHVTID